MHLNTLQTSRHEVYGCFERAADALFNTIDVLLLCFERQWPSLYEAFDDGLIAHDVPFTIVCPFWTQSESARPNWTG